MKALIKKIAERLDRDLFSIAGVVSGILPAAGPLENPIAAKLLDMSVELSAKIRAALPEPKKHLIDELDGVYVDSSMAYGEEQFATGVLLGAMLAGKSRRDAISMATMFKPHKWLDEDGELYPEAHRNYKKPSGPLDEVVDEIIHQTDTSFPQALLPKMRVILWSTGEINKFFQPHANKKIYNAMIALLEEGAKALDQDPKKVVNLALDWLENEAREPVAIAYAAGLRAAGCSVEYTRRMLRGLLRHYEPSSVAAESAPELAKKAAKANGAIPHGTENGHEPAIQI